MESIEPSIAQLDLFYDLLFALYTEKYTIRHNLAHLEYYLRKQVIIQLNPKFYFHSPFTVSAGLLLAAFSV